MSGDETTGQGRWCDQSSPAGVPLWEGLSVKPKVTDGSFKCCEDTIALHLSFSGKEIRF